MRISTSQIYSAGTLNIQRNQSALYKLQNQISSNTRVLTPEDDPVAAAQALLVGQSASVNAQYMTNQGNASSQLGLVDGQLTSLTNLLQSVRDKVVQAGNTGTLSDSDRADIATELTSRLSEMVGIANSKNGTGDYLFSGYQGATLPFAIDGRTSSYAYYGDDGERSLQVASSRKMAVNLAGSDVFMNSRAGNGTLATTAGKVAVTADAANTATVQSVSVQDNSLWNAAVQSTKQASQALVVTFTDSTHYQIYDPVSNTTTAALTYDGVSVPLKTGALDFGAELTLSGVPASGDKFYLQSDSNQGAATIDSASVTDQQKWLSAVNGFAWQDATNPAVELRFSVVSGATTYQLYDVSDPASPTAISTSRAFTAGQAIVLSSENPPAASVTDFGSQLVIKGQPADGDVFTVTPSSGQSLFQTMQNLIGILKSPLQSSGASATQYSNDLATQLTNLDQGIANVSQAQTVVGTRLSELDALKTSATDLNLQYQSTLSDLLDLDFAKALSDFSMQNMYLEAAQKSFVQISGLSLFNYL